MTLLDILPSLGQAASPRFDPAIWPITAHPDEEGRLCIGGVPLADIADEFHTPAYVIDEADFRHRARRYRKTLCGAGDTEVVYAGKSLLSTAVARWAREEGLGIDVCSSGELAVALAGGVDPARIVMHGNAKSPEELREAVRVGVGRIVLDSSMEIAYLAGLAQRRQPVLIRVTPDIDIHGHRAVTTGVSDQKFGFTLHGDRADVAAQRVLSHPDPRPGRPALPYRLAGHRPRPVRRGDPPDDRRDGRHPGPARRHPHRAEHRRRARHPLCPRRSRAESRATGRRHRECARRSLCRRAFPAAADRGGTGAGHLRPGRRDAVPGVLDQNPAGWAHLRRGRRRHERQPAGLAVRRAIHGRTGQPAFAGTQAAGHRRRPALRGGRRDRPRYRTPRGPAPRRPAGRGLHRRLPPQHGVELQHGRPARRWWRSRTGGRANWSAGRRSTDLLARDCG